jgi:hypothetical protein
MVMGYATDTAGTEAAAKEFADMAAGLAEARVKEELRRPPPYKHVGRCRWLVPKPPPRGSDNMNGRGIGNGQSGKGKAKAKSKGEGGGGGGGGGKRGREREREREEGAEEQVCSCAAARVRCGEGCLNRQLYMECTPATCSYGKDTGEEEGRGGQQWCGNRDLQRRNNKAVETRPTPGKGWGLFAACDLKAGDFIIEYCGEIIDDAICEQRLLEHKENGQVSTRL